MIYHSFRNKLTHSDKSFAYTNRGNPDTLIIFIHGFTGDCFFTWNQFPTLVRCEADFKNSDILFYDYESTKSQIEFHALNFSRLLRELLETEAGRKTLLKADTFPKASYNNILLVAHSMGAIVVRRALLNMYNTGVKDWMSFCKMLLFAPAHCGALKNWVLNGRYPWYVELVRNRILDKRPVVDQLMEGSSIIKNLEKDSADIAVKPAGDFVIAKAVVWAESETVVVNRRFCLDPEAIPVHGKNHTTVCKPEISSYLQPYDIVKSFL